MSKQQIYAEIRPRSKYFGQTDQYVVFPVEIGGTESFAGYTGKPLDHYTVAGNGNNYRLRDLWLYVEVPAQLERLGAKRLTINTTTGTRVATLLRINA